MNPTATTIAFLRTLTLDGYLAGEEVWALAKFFNDRPECMEAWPGDVLAPMLRGAFEDAELSEEEMVALAETIGGIEQEWMDKLETPDLPDDETVLPGPPRPARMPAIDQRIEVPAQHGAASYVVALKEHTCSCPEGAGRNGMPPGNPSRCCRHMAYAFARSGKIFEPWFQALLDDCFAHGRGTPPGREWVLLDLPPRKAVLLAGGNGQWCTVFAPGDSGYEAFAYHPAGKRWSYGDSPANARLIEHATREVFLPAQPR